MKTLTYTTLADGPAVLDAILAQFPAWRGTPGTFRGVPSFTDPLVTLNVTKTGLLLTVPDTADEVALLAIVTAAPTPAQAQVNAIAAADLAEPALVDVRDQASTAVTNNDAYLAVVGPTNVQVVAQVRALTQQSTKLIKALGRVIVKLKAI